MRARLRQSVGPFRFTYDGRGLVSWGVKVGPITVVFWQRRGRRRG